VLYRDLLAGAESRIRNHSNRSLVGKVRLCDLMRGLFPSSQVLILLYQGEGE